MYSVSVINPDVTLWTSPHGSGYCKLVLTESVKHHFDVCNETGYDQATIDKELNAMDGMTWNVQDDRAIAKEADAIRRMFFPDKPKSKLLEFVDVWIAGPCQGGTMREIIDGLSDYPDYADAICDCCDGYTHDGEKAVFRIGKVFLRVSMDSCAIRSPYGKIKFTGEHHRLADFVAETLTMLSSRV